MQAGALNIALPLKSSIFSKCVSAPAVETPLSSLEFQKAKTHSAREIVARLC
jgi:hypothetical protein